MADGNEASERDDRVTGTRLGAGTIGVWAMVMVGCTTTLGDPTAYAGDGGGVLPTAYDDAYEDDNEELLNEYAEEDADRAPDEVIDEDGVVVEPTLADRTDGFFMADEDLSADYNDRETIADMVAIANLGTTHIDEAELAEIAAWDEAHGDAMFRSSDGTEPPLDRGEGPAVTADFARGQIIRVEPDGTVVGWACDRRNPGQSVVALVTVRNDSGIRMREAVLADQLPVPTWSRRWIRSRCGDTAAHLFRLRFDRQIGCNNQVSLTLVGHRDRQRYFVRRRRLRCSPIGNVLDFNVQNRRLRAIRGWACDQERPDGQVVITVHSSRTGRLRQRRTDINHGRRVHVRCLGGQRHRFRFTFDRNPPRCGTTETIRVYAHNLGERGSNRVLIGKRRIRGGRCTSSGYGSDYSAGAPTWGGCRYVTNEVIGIVNANGGYGVTSRKRTETYGNPSSDHYTGNSLADAVDFATGNNYSLAQTIRSRLAGGTHREYESFTIRRDGHTFRGQLIAGTHGTGPHLHFGCRRID